MASESFDENSKAKRPTVQIGDPFFEKLLIEACLEVMAADLVVAIQDMGAAGLTSSSFEMASKGGVGLSLHLDHVPLRDPTMQPEEILLSESQERMLLVCEPSKFNAIRAIVEKWGLDATQIGEVQEKRVVDLYWKNEKICSIDPDLLVENAPQHQRPYKKWEPRNETKNTSDLTMILSDPRATLSQVLRETKATSRDWIYRQYDQRVGAATVRDCRDSVGIVRLPDSKRALGIVLGCRPHVMRTDAFIGGADAVLYPAFELAAKGFETLAVTDCLNFGNPEKENIMSEFVASLDGMNQACRRLRAPIISGNVSFYNETMNQNITSTPSTGLVGLRSSIENIPRSHFTTAGDALYMLRIPSVRLGGLLKEQFSGTSPYTGQFDVNELADFVTSTRRICSHPAIHSTRVVGKYGLAYALARMCFDEDGRPGLGVHINIAKLNRIRKAATPDELFHELFYEVLIAVDQSEEMSFLEGFNSELKIIKPLEMHSLATIGGDRLKIGSFMDCRIHSMSDDYLAGWGVALG